MTLHGTLSILIVGLVRETWLLYADELALIGVGLEWEWWEGRRSSGGERTFLWLRASQFAILSSSLRKILKRRGGPTLTRAARREKGAP